MQRDFAGVPARVIGAVVRALLSTTSKRATKYLSPSFTVKACRVTYDKRPPDRRASRADIVLTIGAPNHLERAFIKKCNRAGEPFPVRKIQLKAFPKKKK